MAKRKTKKTSRSSTRRLRRSLNGLGEIRVGGSLRNAINALDKRLCRSAVEHTMDAIQDLGISAGRDDSKGYNVASKLIDETRKLVIKACVINISDNYDEITRLKAKVAAAP